MKALLASGDVFLNPALLAYAVVKTDTEGPQLRLGITGSSDGSPGEIVLTGLEARSVLRWLRTNSEFLDSGAPNARWDRPAGSDVRHRTDPRPTRGHLLGACGDA